MLKLIRSYNEDIKMDPSLALPYLNSNLIIKESMPLTRPQRSQTLGAKPKNSVEASKKIYGGQKCRKTINNTQLCAQSGMSLPNRQLSNCKELLIQTSKKKENEIKNETKNGIPSTKIKKIEKQNKNEQKILKSIHYYGKGGNNRIIIRILQPKLKLDRCEKFELHQQKKQKQIVNNIFNFDQKLNKLLQNSSYISLGIKKREEQFCQKSRRNLVVQACKPEKRMVDMRGW